MAEPASGTATIPTRALPRDPHEVSVLGMVAEPGPLRGPEADRSVVGRLRRAHQRGVTLFDASGSSDPARAEGLLRTAFTGALGSLTLVLRAPPAGQDPPRRTEGLRLLFEETDPVEAGRSGASTVLHLAAGSETLPPPASSGLYSGSFSLLDRHLLHSFTGSPAGGPLGLLARDPFAGGLLDGARFSGDWLNRRPIDAPASLRSLTEQYGPVLRLGFLTEGRRRTLAQAAILYAAAHPWVVSVLVPLPAPERLEEVLGTFSRPPLSPDDLARVEKSGEGPGVPAPSVK